MPDETMSESGAGFFGKVWARFGEVAKRLGIVHEHDVNEALEHQERTLPRKKLGEILVEKGKMTDDHVETILREQRSGAVQGAPAVEAPKPKEPAPEAPPPQKPKRKTGRQAAKKVAKKAKKKSAKKTRKTKKTKKKSATRKSKR